jgi:hypothetical protein
MKAQTLLTKVAAGLGTVALALAMSACSHHTSVAQSAGQTTGEIRTEQSAQQQSSSGEVLGTAPAPSNTQGTSASSTPAVISGPAAVDSTGRVYTSSTVGSAGNASGTGTNTNVNIVPKTSSSNVTVTTSPAPVVTTETTTTTVETTPAPVVVETPAPAPVVVETPAPMTSSTTIETPAPVETTTTTQTTHKRLRKD